MVQGPHHALHRQRLREPEGRGRAGGACTMVINGRVELACQKLVRDFKTAGNFVIEPLPLNV